MLIEKSARAGYRPRGETDLSLEVVQHENC